MTYTNCLHYTIEGPAVITPEHWRDLQLNRMVSNELTMPTIRNFVRHQFVTLKDIQLVVKTLAFFHYKKMEQRLIVAVDEANVLISNFPTIFARPSDPAKHDHPIWSLVGSIIANISSVAVIAAGTRIHLRDATVLVSSLAKGGQVVKLKTNFR